LFFRKKKLPVVNQHELEAPFESLRDSIIAEALKQNSDGVQLVPGAEGTLVYYRLNGEWQEAARLPAHLHRRVVRGFRSAAALPPARWSGLEIGLIGLETANAGYEAYACFMPTRAGIKIQIRIFPEESAPADLSPVELLQLF
jgi:type II secretory ATPase GspE/PulE/Tfp pilus assembly ATPase PilB-like protein